MSSFFSRLFGRKDAQQQQQQSPAARGGDEGARLHARLRELQQQAWKRAPDGGAVAAAEWPARLQRVMARSLAVAAGGAVQSDDARMV